MGFISGLLSRTGPGKMMAAQNALVAKYTFLTLTDLAKESVIIKVRELLISGGMPNAESFMTSMEEDRFYGMAAIAMFNLGIKPGLPNILFHDQWNSISNPLVALSGAQREIDMVTLEIKRKHNIDINITM